MAASRGNAQWTGGNLMGERKTTGWVDGIRQVANNKWQGRIYYIDPKTGKQRDKIFTCRTKSECKKRRILLKEELESQTSSALVDKPEKQPVYKTVADLVADSLQDDAYDNQRTTTASNQSYARVYIYPSDLGKMAINDVKRNDVDDFIKELKRRPLQRQKTEEVRYLSPKTIRGTYWVLHKAFDRAVDRELIAQNPASGCKTLPALRKPTINVFSRAETKKFIEATRDDPYWVLFVVDLFTGMRQNELLGLTWDRVNFDDGSIWVSRQIQRKNGVHYLRYPKHNSIRRIKPAPDIMHLLAIRKAKQKKEETHAGKLWDNSLNLVFTNGIGQPLSDRTVYKHFKKAAAALGKPEMRFHDLRHTYAVNSLLAGEDPKTISSNLGHRSVAFTLEVYATYTNDMRDISAKNQQRLIDEMGVLKLDDQTGT